MAQQNFERYSMADINDACYTYVLLPTNILEDHTVFKFYRELIRTFAKNQPQSERQ